MISVVIPIHNRRKNLYFTLKALSLQTLPKSAFEVIVADDGSTDDPYRAITEYESVLAIKYVRLTKKDEWNASRPRNYGAKLAEKTSLAYVFVDSDVMLNKFALACYAEDFTRNKNRVVIGPYNWLPPMYMDASDIEFGWKKIISGEMRPAYVNGPMGTIGEDVRMMSFDKAQTPDDTFGEAFDGLACFGGNLMIPRDIFWSVGGYDENIFYGCEDGDLGLTLWSRKIPFSYDKRTIGYHVWHPLSEARGRNTRREIDKLNQKHFGTTEQKLIQYTREAYKNWGIDWNPPPEWEVKN